MIILIGIVALIILMLIIGKINLSIQFKKEVRMLFETSESQSDQVFHTQQLFGLPEPVQRYFKYILKDGQSYINDVKITHKGLFKTGLDKKWVPITGEQYATTQHPGFIWKGVTSFFTARDMYIADKGRLIVLLLSLFKVVDAKGESYDQGELLRWLGESVMYPTNLLPSDRLEWKAVDLNTAKLRFNHNKLELFFDVTFNELGEIVQMETKRYMDNTKLETWLIKCADYKEMNSIKVPTTFEVLWRLKEGDFSYAKFNIKEIFYNRRALFLK